MTHPLRAFRPAALLLLASAAAALVLIAAPAQAGKNPNSKLVLHVVPFTNRSTCLNGRLNRPEDAVTRGDLVPAKYIAYVLIADGTPGAGLSGCQFGITYNDSTGRGVDILDWSECTLFNWPEPGWPDSGTGNLLTWNQNTDCDTTGMRVVGYFTLEAHSPDRLALIYRPADKRAAVAGCGMQANNTDAEVLDVIPPENLGFVEFGGGPGYNPWDPKQNLLRFKKPSLKPPRAGSRSASADPDSMPVQRGEGKKKKPRSR